MRINFKKAAGPLMAAMIPFGAAVQKSEAAEPECGGVYQRGDASWYGPNFAGRPMANGETFRPSEPLVAHKSLPLGSRIKVKRRDNGLSGIFTVKDRGPYIHGRIVDLSRGAAEQLKMIDDGVAPVQIYRCD